MGIVKVVPFIFATAISLFLSYPGLASASPSQPSKVVLREKIKKVVIFPLKNLSGEFGALKKLTPLLHKKIRQRGYAVEASPRVERFLNERRIRTTDSVDRATALSLRRTLKADALLLGSLDQYGNRVGEDISLGLTLRLVGTRTAKILWMETVALSGKDFAGFLGFGRLTSLTDLTEKALTSITEKMPSSYSYKPGEEIHYEVEKVSLTPSTIRGGEEVKVSLKLLSLTTSPGELKARLGGEVFPLIAGAGGRYSGKISFHPGRDGLYPLHIEMEKNPGSLFTFSSAALIEVDSTAPSLTLTPSKDAMAGMAKKDHILFHTGAGEKIERWRAEIYDSEGRLVRSGENYGPLPPKLIWRGEKNSGSPADDGDYFFTLAAWDKAGNRGQTRKKIRLDATPPKVDIKGSPKNQEALLFSLRYDEKEEIDHWELMVFNEKAERVNLIEGKGNPDFELTLPLSSLTGNYPLDSLFYAFKAIDRAGNLYQTTNGRFLHGGQKAQRFSRTSPALFPPDF